MQTLTAEQFKKKYGQAGLESLAQTVQPNTGYLSSLKESVGTDIANRVQRVSDIQSRDTGLLTKGVQTFGQGAGLAANTLEQTVFNIPGVKQGLQGLGTGINWLATSEKSPIKHLGDVIGSSKVLQTATKLYDTDQNFKDTIDAVANIVRLGGDVQTAIDSANFTANVTNKVIRNVKETGGNVVEATKAKVSDIAQEQPAVIMNRVARLKPTDAQTFQKLSGKTHGEYLAETGNFGSPDQILQNESIKFTNSLNSVDDTLSKLPGYYKDGSIKDALTGLLEKAKSVSSENVPAPYLNEVKSFIAKYNTDGLTMSDINAVKRLYEKNVKLGYNKLLNADKVEQATNVDSALRNWQVKQAEKLGFTNISDLNKQTQLSKFLINKLGDQVIGQNGLNGITLTDWIVLGGGNPSAVAGFLTKRFFSSKSVQAKIAEMLNQSAPKEAIKANLNPTVESNLRTAFPKGTIPELPAGDVNAPQVQNNVAIPRNAPFSAEAPAKNIFNESQVTRAKQTQLPQLEKSKSTLPKSTIESSLIQEAKKYKSAEEFVKAQDKTATGAKVPDILKVYALDDKDLGQIYRQSGLKSSAYPADFTAKNNIPELKIQKGDKVSILANDKEAKRFTIENIPERKTESGTYSKSAQVGDLVEGYSRQDQIDFINKNFSKEGLTKSQLTDIWKKANKK